MAAHLASGIRPQAAYAFSLDFPLPTGTRDLPAHWWGWKRRYWPAAVIRPGILLYGFDKRARILSVLLRIERGGAFTYRSRPEFSRRVREFTGSTPSNADPYWPTLPIPKKGNPCTGIAVKCRVIKLVRIPWRGRFNRLGWEKLTDSPFERLGADVGNHFTTSRTYSREQIRKHVRGGTRDYLPHYKGVVVAACLTRSANPDAPKVILAGRGKNIYRWAVQLSKQTGPIPVFVKEGPHSWRYHGHYRVQRWSEASSEIREHSRRSGRNDISRVIWLERLKRAGSYIGAALPCTSVEAVENTRTEVVAYRRGRSRALREGALERSGGICAACGRNFSRIAGGLGRSALQVHHRKQLAASDRPVLTGPGDLAVVCANCHMMIHSDPCRALTIHQLRRRFGT